MRIIYLTIKGVRFKAGIENYTFEIAKRLSHKGHDVIIYSMRHYSDKREELIDGVKIISVPVLRNRSLEKQIGYYLGTLDSLKWKNVDILHYQGFGAGLSCILPRLLGRKVIVHGHGIEWRRTRWNSFGRMVLKFLEIPSVLLPNVVFVVSKVQRDYVKRKYGVNAIYIPPGINEPQFEFPDLITQKYNLKGGDFILFVGRLVREKGVHYLIEAYKGLKTDIKLVIAGDAPYEDSYKKYIRHLAADDERIIFTGFVEGKLLRELFSNCYLFVLPSDLEGFPIVLLEAMSYNRTCLVSDTPENLEALNKLGYCFKAGDIVDLKDKIIYLLKNANNEIGIEAGSYVLKYFNWKHIADNVEDMYMKLLIT